MRAMRAAVAAVGLALVPSGLAEAQWMPEKTTIQDVPAARGAFELGASASYTQPFGEMMAGENIAEILDAGAAVWIDLGYRIDPHVSVGTSLLFHESSADASLGVGNSFHGTAATIALTYHILPHDAVDPYLSAGAGYRVLVSALRGADNDLTTHGPQMGRLLVGLDFRTSKDVALGPFLGADVNAFLWQASESAGEHARIRGASANAFVYAGFGARFDVGGQRELNGVPVVVRIAFAD
jgi:hypothetical protein